MTTSGQKVQQRINIGNSLIRRTSSFIALEETGEETETRSVTTSRSLHPKFFPTVQNEKIKLRFTESPSTSFVDKPTQDANVAKKNSIYSPATRPIPICLYKFIKPPPQPYREKRAYQSHLLAKVPESSPLLELWNQRIQRKQATSPKDSVKIMLSGIPSRTLRKASNAEDQLNQPNQPNQPNPAIIPGLDISTEQEKNPKRKFLKNLPPSLGKLDHDRKKSILELYKSMSTAKDDSGKRPSSMKHVPVSPRKRSNSKDGAEQSSSKDSPPASSGSFKKRVSFNQHVLVFNYAPTALSKFNGGL